MPNMWVLVANSAQARILTAASPSGALEEFECLAHPASRLRDQDIASDRPGRTFDRYGPGRHGKAPEVTPREEEAVRFAEQVAARLRQAHATGEFDRLTIVAAPHFLGLLRERLGPQVSKAVVETLDKDFATLAPAEIRARLPERLYSTLQ